MSGSSSNPGSRSRLSAGHASTSQVPDPALRTGADTGVAPNCPYIEDLDDMSVTNSEVESAIHYVFSMEGNITRRHLLGFLQFGIGSS